MTSVGLDGTTRAIISNLFSFFAQNTLPLMKGVVIMLNTYILIFIISYIVGFCIGFPICWHIKKKRDHERFIADAFARQQLCQSWSNTGFAWAIIKNEENNRNHHNQEES